MTVFPLQYFPPIPWFVAAQRETTLRLEVSQHYRKQRYTNRMRIRAANRVLPLIIPLERTGSKTAIADKRISYQDGWHKQHWKSIESAYRAAPYFEYYETRLRPFYQGTETSLLTFHLEALRWILELLQLDPEIQLSESYSPPDSYQTDYRNVFDPTGAHLPTWFQPLPYPQVFEGFVPGLTILDLIFNEGPNARLLLKNMLND